MAFLLRRLEGQLSVLPNFTDPAIIFHIINDISEDNYSVDASTLALDLGEVGTRYCRLRECSPLLVSCLVPGVLSIEQHATRGWLQNSRLHLNSR